MLTYFLLGLAGLEAWSDCPVAFELRVRNVLAAATTALGIAGFCRYAQSLLLTGDEVIRESVFGRRRIKLSNIVQVSSTKSLAGLKSLVLEANHSRTFRITARARAVERFAERMREAVRVSGTSA